MALDKYRRFIAKARRNPVYWARIAVRDYTEELLERLGEKPRAELAKAAKVSPAYITKVLRGDENLTIGTMAKLALAVGGKVRIHIADLDAETRWLDCYTPTGVSTVSSGAVTVQPVRTGAGSIEAAA